MTVYNIIKKSSENGKEKKEKKAEYKEDVRRTFFFLREITIIYIDISVYILNRCPVANNIMLFGKKPDVRRLRIFDFIAFRYIRKQYT